MSDPRQEKAISRFRQAASERKLVAVIGTGVSLGLAPDNPTLSWKGLVKDGFAYGVRLGKIQQAQSDRWQPQIDSTDLDDLLGAAEFVGRKLGAPNGDLYARWLAEAFAVVKPTQREMIQAVTTLQAAEVPLCTLNYDHLLEEVTGLSPITLDDLRGVTTFIRREESGILHLHGSFRRPATCVLGIRDYATTLGSEVRDLLQRTLSAFNHLLFIGCGGTFDDPNFSNLIRWLRSNLGAAAPEHHALVRAEEVARYDADPAWHGFVQPVSFGVKYDDLPGFLVRHFTISEAPPSVQAHSAPPSGSVRDADLLSRYRAFLLRDCGEMTIEGIRGADMDTTQRRFEIERLFVPSKLVPLPPEISERDPERERKLVAWRKANSEPRPFGAVFQEHPRLALLALPGGGKTMLLKRLAVAYADPARRSRCPDMLPDLDLTPVLIRCRQWREQPILSLLEHLHVITGRSELEGLREALLPLFGDGRALLLIDGLDEIHNDALRTTFVEYLETFLDEYPNTRLVVTSREAGFSLVAPRVASFCQRFRIAALDEDAIRDLCAHWHRLMGGDSTVSEGEEIAKQILEKPPLRRLAENPLLLTMLLVVKHGAGRIPPDKVSLYGRAVEVLLDTWNIQGHARLSLKEAVPQLAYVAYEMMRAGKQTATENELLDYLEMARMQLPRISLFAKDRPDEFLRRVELRSSLLVEAGHQVDLGWTVPFYQFRHLTFQEYLAAVAAVEGHYSAYKPGDTALTPLEAHLAAEEWKEVIPMAAVLAKKAAEPLVSALAARGHELMTMAAEGKPFEGQAAWLDMSDASLPPAVERLVECLIGEAELTSDTLKVALRVIVFFARACSFSHDWETLSRGPYGGLLLQQAIELYMPMNWLDETWISSTCVRLTRWRDEAYKRTEGETYLERLLQSDGASDVVQGLFSCVGLLWTGWEQERIPLSARTMSALQPLVEKRLFDNNPAIWCAAAWAWAAIELCDEKQRIVPTDVLDRLFVLWLNTTRKSLSVDASIAFANLRQPRGTWSPKLTTSQKRLIRKATADQRIVSEARDPGSLSYIEAALIIAFHDRTIWNDSQLWNKLAKIQHWRPDERAGIRFIKAELQQSQGSTLLQSEQP